MQGVCARGYISAMHRGHHVARYAVACQRLTALLGHAKRGPEHCLRRRGSQAHHDIRLDGVQLRQQPRLASTDLASVRLAALPKHCLGGVAVQVTSTTVRARLAERLQVIPLGGKKRRGVPGQRLVEEARLMHAGWPVQDSGQGAAP